MAIKITLPKETAKPSHALNAQLVDDYLDLQARIKKLSGELDEKKQFIKEQLSKFGIADSKGNVVIEIGNHTIKNEARTSVILNNEKAEEYCRENGLWEKVTSTMLDETKIEKCFHDGVISPDVMETLVEKKVVYALKVK